MEDSSTSNSNLALPQRPPLTPRPNRNGSRNSLLSTSTGSQVNNNSQSHSNLLSALSSISPRMVSTQPDVGVIQTQGQRSTPDAPASTPTTPAKDSGQSSNSVPGGGSELNKDQTRPPALSPARTPRTLIRSITRTEDNLLDQNMTRVLLKVLRPVHGLVSKAFQLQDALKKLSEHAANKTIPRSLKTIKDLRLPMKYQSAASKELSSLTGSFDCSTIDILMKYRQMELKDVDFRLLSLPEEAVTTLQPLLQSYESLSLIGTTARLKVNEQAKNFCKEYISSVKKKIAYKRFTELNRREIKFKKTEAAKLSIATASNEENIREIIRKEMKQEVQRQVASAIKKSTPPVKSGSHSGTLVDNNNNNNNKNNKNKKKKPTRPPPKRRSSSKNGKRVSSTHPNPNQNRPPSQTVVQRRTGQRRRPVRAQTNRSTPFKRRNQSISPRRRGRTNRRGAERGRRRSI